MKIIKLEAENIKRLKAISITPDANTVVVTGKNGAGKSSVIDSIWYALGGNSAQKEIINPIRNGEKKASITLDLGNIIVKRWWTSNDKTYLEVKSTEGAKFSSPQKMLDELVGMLSFDPLAYVHMEAQDQIKALLKVGKIEIDLNEHEMKKKSVYDDRTIVNRELKNLNVQLDSMSVPETDLPEDVLSSDDVIKEIDLAMEIKHSNDLKRKKLSTLSESFNTLKKQREELEKKLEEMSEELVKLSEEGKQLNVEVKNLEDPDIDLLKSKLSNVESINDKIRARKTYISIESKIDVKQKESEKLTREIEDLDNKKREALENAKFPIKGLSFSENGVTFNEIPFTQCSSAEQLKISLAMAMAMNPKLKVILIRDGSLLDSDNMKVIEKLAKEKDYQVWIEKVDETGEVGIMIEDGEIKASQKKAVTGKTSQETMEFEV